MNLRRTPLYAGLASVAVALASCGEAPVEPVAEAVPPTPRCERADEAPLRRPDGGRACRAVGADLARSSGEFPDATGATAPLAYVAPGVGPGTGTRDAPFHDLASALAAAPRPATLLLARGRYVLPATLVLSTPVAIVGAGADATALVAPTREPALHIGAPGDGSLAVRLAHLAVLREAAAAPCAASRADATGVLASGEGTDVEVRDVVVEGDGVTVERGATLHGEGLTVARARCEGLVVTTGGAAFLRGVFVRDGGRVGVFADGALLALDTAFVTRNGRDGVTLRGGRSTGGCLTDADCPALAAPPGFPSVAQTCLASLAVPGHPAERRCHGTSALVDLASLDNRVTALRAERAPPDAASVAAGLRDFVLSQPGAVLRGTRLVLAGTRVPAGVIGGDGLYVGPGADLTLDEGVTREEDMGNGSEIVGNARVGVLVDGDPASEADGGLPAAPRRAGALSLAGARVASNGGPGVYVQEGARVGRIAYSVVEANVGVGLGVTSQGAVAGLFCDRFVGTRLGALRLADARVVTLGDGVALSDTAGGRGPTAIAGCAFDRNARFGLVVSGSDAVTVAGGRGNRGAGNRYGVGSYGGNVNGDLEGLGGREPAPRTPPPTLRGALDVSAGL